MAKCKANPKTGNPGTSKFTGGLFGFIGISILQFLLIVFTLTLGTAWAVCMKMRWYAKHTQINGKQVRFDGKGIQLFGTYIKWFILTVLTLGIFAFWLGIKMEKWKLKHTFIEETATQMPAQFNGGYPVMPQAPAQMPMQMPQMPQAPVQMPYGYPMMPPAPYPYAQMAYGCPMQNQQNQK